MRYWWQSTVLLLAIFVLVACSGATSQVELEQVEAVSTAPIPSPSPEPSETPLPTEMASLTPTPQPSQTTSSEPPTPTATSAPTEVPTATAEIPEVYSGEMGYINFEPTDFALIEAELAKPEYINTWPLTKDVAGDYGFEGIITNHQRVNIELPDGHVIKLLSEFYYNDANGDIQLIDIPLFMENQNTGYSYLSINSNLGIEYSWSEEELVEGLVKTWWYLDTKGSIIERAVLDFKRTTNPNYVVEGGDGPYQRTVHSDFYLTTVLDELGVVPEQIWAFAQSGNPSTLGTFEGMNFLIPSVIVAPETN